MKQRYHGPAVATLTFLIAVGAAGAQVGYTITDLGSLRGAASSYATAISDNGLVVGFTDGRSWRAVLFTPRGPIELGTLGGLEGRTFGVNASGVVVGYSENAATDFRPCVWTSPGNVTELMRTPGGKTGVARAINNNGDIVGTSYNSYGNARATLWHAGLPMDLGSVGGGLTTDAIAINALGHVVGFYEPGSNGAKGGFFWTPEAGMVDLGSFEPASLNDEDMVVGTLSGGTGAAFWTAGGGIQGIGTLGGTNGTSAANGVNNHGVIVGNSSTILGIAGPFVYANGVMRDLNDLIPWDAPWFVLESANAINNSGQIVGYGVTAYGYTHAFLLTPINVNLTNLAIAPSTVIGGNTATGKITLNAKTAVDLPVTLTNTTPAASAPATVVVPAGTSSASFIINTSPVNTLASGTLTATLGTTSKSVTLKVRPIAIKTFTVLPSSLKNGGTATGTITLELPAPTGGTNVTLSSTKPATAGPAVPSIVIPEGATVGTFTVNAGTVAVTTTAKINAATGGATKSVTVTVSP